MDADEKQVAVHDPAIIYDNDKYYIFGTHMTAAVSSDLRKWEYIAEGVSRENRLFDNLFDEEMKAFKYTGKFNSKEYAVWAPDVSYNPVMKKYVMYFCTTGSYVKSSICLAVADNIEGPYHYVRDVLQSGFDESSIGNSNFYEVMPKKADFRKYLKKNGHYNNLAWPNCIDPNVFWDKDGREWMVYGSWSGGVFLIEIDQATGMPIHPKDDKINGVDSYFGRKLLGGGHKSIEGPYILYVPKYDCYYLFVSFGWLGAEGGYQIRQFRSRKPEGPYVDMNGRNFKRVNHHEGYGFKMFGNYKFQDMKYGCKSPGHNSAFTDADGGMYIVYHQRFDDGTQRHEPKVHQVFLTRNGWLVAAPYSTAGEILCEKKYHEAEVNGTYEYINHANDILDEVKLSVKAELLMDGSICSDGMQIGSYMLYDNSKISLEIEGISYEGVIICMNNEAGESVMCISAAGNNTAVWLVKKL